MSSSPRPLSISRRLTSLRRRSTSSMAWYTEIRLGPLPVKAPAWLRLRAAVYDTRLRRWGIVMDLGWPRDRRQRARAWLRPPRGGREWNPKITDLSPTDPNNGENQ